MRLSVTFSGFGGLSDTFPAVLAAEQHGLDGVWTAEHLSFHDGIVPSAMYLRATERIQVGVVGLSPVSRHPALTAMELGSLSEMGPGRVRVQVGTGDAGLIAKLGKRIDKPVGATAAFVTDLRETMAGRDMKLERELYSFDGFRMNPLGPVPPIDIMAIRPMMLRTAARVGDGLSISVGGSDQYLRDTVKIVEDELAAHGRDRASFRITALAIAAVGDDLPALCGPLAAMLTTFPQETAGYLARGVLDAEELVKVEREEGMFGLMKIWTPEAVQQIAFISKPAGLGDALARYADTGIDELGLMLLNPPDTQPDIIRQLAAART